MGTSNVAEENIETIDVIFDERERVLYTKHHVSPSKRRWLEEREEAAKQQLKYLTSFIDYSLLSNRLTLTVVSF